MERLRFRSPRTDDLEAELLRCRERRRQAARVVESGSAPSTPPSDATSRRSPRPVTGIEEPGVAAG